MGFAAAMFATLVLTAPGAPSDTAPRHEDEIEVFANLMALAQVTSDHCADILVNLPLLAEFQRRAHVVSADDAAVSRFGRAAIASYTARSPSCRAGRPGATPYTSATGRTARSFRTCCGDDQPSPSPLKLACRSSPAVVSPR